MKRRTLLQLLGTAMFLAVASGKDAYADKKGRRHRHDEEAIRQARERGEILPLEEILLAVRASTPGEVVKVEIEHRGDLWVYEFKIVTPEGRRLDVYVNARTKEIVKIEGK